MSIKHVMLGLLSQGPATGYDLKKVMECSPMMPWSGNNNQIYKTLVQLLNEGLVCSEHLLPESGPGKKQYTLTPAGWQELKTWALSEPDLPEFRKPFLLQLARADLLSDQELQTLLDQYAARVQMQLQMVQELHRRNPHSASNPRQALLNEQIQQNLSGFYQQELDWVSHLKAGLAALEQEVPHER